jgi:toxin ParE1/3/4
LMGRIVVHDRAKADLDEIADYIARGSVDAALRFYDAARRTFDMIADFPGAGTAHPIAGRPELATLRTWPIRKFRDYVACYVLGAGGPEVVRVLHGARDVDRVM